MMGDREPGGGTTHQEEESSGENGQQSSMMVQECTLPLPFYMFIHVSYFLLYVCMFYSRIFPCIFFVALERVRCLLILLECFSSPFLFFLLTSL